MRDADLTLVAKRLRLPEQECLPATGRTRRRADAAMQSKLKKIAYQEYLSLEYDGQA